MPTPLAGAVYILDRDRVHVLDVPFTQAISTVSRWGAGSSELVAAMERGERSSDLAPGEFEPDAPQPALRP